MASTANDRSIERQTHKTNEAAVNGRSCIVVGLVLVRVVTAAGWGGRLRRSGFAPQSSAWLSVCRPFQWKFSLSVVIKSRVWSSVRRAPSTSSPVTRNEKKSGVEYKTKDWKLLCGVLAAVALWSGPTISRVGKICKQWFKRYLRTYLPTVRFSASIIWIALRARLSLRCAWKDSMASHLISSCQADLLIPAASTPACDSVSHSKVPCGCQAVCLVQLCRPGGMPIRMRIYIKQSSHTRCEI